MSRRCRRPIRRPSHKRIAVATAASIWTTSTTDQTHDPAIIGTPVCPRIYSTDVNDFMCKTHLVVGTPGGRSSPNHLGRLEEEGWGNSDPKGLGRLQVDHQRECGGLLDRQIGGVGAIEELPHGGSGAPELLRQAHPLCHEAAGLQNLPTCRS
jgi:hypothetical protein